MCYHSCDIGVMCTEFGGDCKHTVAQAANHYRKPKWWTNKASCRIVRTIDVLVQKSWYIVFDIDPSHDDIMSWKRFPHYWPFVSGIDQSSMNSHHKHSVMQCFDVLFVISLYTVEQRVELLWRHFDDNIVQYSNSLIHRSHISPKNSQ